MQYHESAKPIGAYGEHLQLLRLRGVQGALFAWPGRRLLLLGLMADRDALATPGAAPGGAVPGRGTTRDASVALALDLLVGGTAAAGVLPTGTSSAASRAVAPGGAPAAAGAATSRVVSAAGAATAPGGLDAFTGAAIGTTGAAVGTTGAAVAGFAAAARGFPAAHWGLGGGLLCLVRHVCLRRNGNLEGKQRASLDQLQEDAAAEAAASTATPVVF